MLSIAGPRSLLCQHQFATKVSGVEVRFTLNLSFNFELLRADSRSQLSGEQVGADEPVRGISISPAEVAEKSGTVPNLGAKSGRIPDLDL